MKAIIQTPKNGNLENAKTTTYNTAIYSNKENKKAFVRNNKVVPILVGNIGGPYREVVLFDFIRDEKSNTKYFEVSIDGNIFSINRETLQNDYTDNVSFPHEFPAINHGSLKDGIQKNNDTYELARDFRQDTLRKKS